MPDPLQPWQRVNSTRCAGNPFFTTHLDRVRLPNGSEHDYHYVRTPGSVLIVAAQPAPPAHAATPGETRLLLVRQFRYLLGRVVVEFPGGGVAEGQQPLAAAQAELAEETGYRAAQWRALGWFNPCKGLLQEQCHVYLAHDLEPLAEPVAGDATEELQTVWLTASELNAAIARGEIQDGMTLAGWALARNAWQT